MNGRAESVAECVDEGVSVLRKGRTDGIRRDGCAIQAVIRAVT